MAATDSGVIAWGGPALAGHGNELTGHELEFRVLGPLTVVRRGSEVVLGGRLQRLVLGLLLVEAGRVVSTDRLVDEVWGVTGPATGTGPLRTYIWQLRQALGVRPDGDGHMNGNAVVVSRNRGYLLDIDPEQLDSVRFERGYADARSAEASGDLALALTHLDHAVDLWRGAAFGDLAAEPAVHKEANRLDQLLLEVQELRAELMLATGDAPRVATELGPLARANPQHERLWVLLMTALYRSGRQGEALRCYQEARAGLVESLGIDPGPELRDLEQAILRQDPVLAGGSRDLISVSDGAANDRLGRPKTTAGADRSATETGLATPSPRAHNLHNLPPQLTSFVGRGVERAAVTHLIDQSRLVTLAGSGGSGKTRLALAVAEDVLPRFPGGVRFVDLSSVSDVGRLARAVAEPFGVELGQLDDLGPLCRRISDQDVLLVLDGCERLVAAVAATSEELLGRCPGLHVLTTSREELGSVAESVWRVPGLSLPEADVLSHERAKVLLESEAVQLFAERGRSVLAGFDPRGAALDAVARICRRLDGIPLAIELAAALVGSLPVAEIDRRLDDRFRLLTGGRRQSVPRHRTLRATLDASFELLDRPAQRLFVQLGVFVGEFTLPAAEAVAGTETDPQAVARGVSHLVRTSMVDCLSSSDGALRYRMLDSIRQYARDRMGTLDDVEEVRRRHAHHYTAFAVDAQHHVHGPLASIWLARVVTELPNLRAAVTWAMAHDDFESGLRLAGSLPWFFSRMALLEEAGCWLDAGLSRRAELTPDLELTALSAASTVAFLQGELRRTGQLGDQSIALARRLDDQHQLVAALMVRGAAAVWAGDLARAEECFAEAEPLSDHLGDRWGTAWMLTCWSAASHYTGRRDHARHQLATALEIFRGLQDPHGQVLPLVHLALFDLEDGRADEALDLARQAARLASATEGRDMQHVSACILGVVELFVGDRQRARELLLASIRDHSDSRNWLIVTRSLESLAGLAVVAGRHRPATALLGYARQARDRRQIATSAAWSFVVHEWLESVTAAIGSDQVETELAQGRAMSLDDALSLAEAATRDL